MLPVRNCYRLSKRFLLLFLVVCFLTCCVLILRYHSKSSTGKGAHDNAILTISHEQQTTAIATPSKIISSDLSKNTVVNSTVVVDKKMDTATSNVNSNVHIFYYPWYGNPTDDFTYLHWNHEYIPNWNKNDKTVYPTGRHIPPDDIGANFYPDLGCYSSRNIDTIHQHMKWIRDSGAGVMVITWYPPDQADQEGKPFDELFPTYLDVAATYGLKVAFHIEPYRDRSPENLKENLDYIITKYGDHPSLYKLAKSSISRPLPVFYIYDSYLTPANSWSALLSRSGDNSIRGTKLDGIYLGLLVELRHKSDILTGGFDGFYTYFAANEFTYGSSWKHWRSLSGFARKNGLLFVPSVGPGYIDTRIRPWNSKTTRPRKNGQCYRNSWNSALQSRPHLISITSFNEWHEGTQIEPAVPKSYQDFSYEDYEPNEPDFYLQLTREFASSFKP